MTPEQQVKYAILLKCADDGLTEPEIAAFVKNALQNKEAFLEQLWAGTKALSGGLGQTAIMLPVMAGGLGGMALAKHDDGSASIDDAKADELEKEYRRLAGEAQSNARRKRLAALTGRRVSRLSPAL